MSITKNLAPFIKEEAGPQGKEFRFQPFAFPGGYAIAYLDQENNTVCAACASERLDGPEPCADWGWETIVAAFLVEGCDDGSHVCDACDRSVDMADQYQEVLDRITQTWQMSYQPHVPADDVPALRESWVNCIDHMERNGEISDREAFDAPGLPDRFEPQR